MAPLYPGTCSLRTIDTVLETDLSDELYRLVSSGKPAGTLLDQVKSLGGTARRQRLTLPMEEGIRGREEEFFAGLIRQTEEIAQAGGEKLHIALRYPYKKEPGGHVRLLDTDETGEPVVFDTFDNPQGKPTFRALRIGGEIPAQDLIIRNRELDGLGVRHTEIVFFSFGLKK